MLTRNTTSPEVKALQEKLIRLGYPLVRWGADSELGDETLSAVEALCKAHGRQRDPDPGVVSDVELRFVDGLIALLDQANPIKQPSRLIDRRMMASRKYDYGPRAVTEIKGVTLHQTACVLSVSKDPGRCDAVGAHYVIMRGAGGYYGDGDIIWLHDEDRRVIHGNEWNNQCWGIEIDGKLAGIKGNPDTVWDDPSTSRREAEDPLTDKQAESCVQLIEWRYYEILRMGGMMTVINAHRQSSANRRNDPGSDPWQRIAMPLMQRLGLHDGGPGFVLGGADGGYPIPREWDPSRQAYGYFDPPSYKPIK